MHGLQSCILIVVLGTLSVMHAQTIGTNKNADRPDAYTLCVKAQLVVEQVIVKDKKGNFVPNLTAKDFALTEDGTTEKIWFVEHEQLPTEAEPMPTFSSTEEQLTTYRHFARAGIASEQNSGDGKSKYQGRRLMVLYST